MCQDGLTNAFYKSRNPEKDRPERTITPESSSANLNARKMCSFGEVKEVTKA